MSLPEVNMCTEEDQVVELRKDVLHSFLLPWTLLFLASFYMLFSKCILRYKYCRHPSLPLSYDSYDTKEKLMNEMLQV